MSERTRCNFCSLNDIITFAESVGREVYVVPMDSRAALYEQWPTSVEVYTVDPAKFDYTWIAMMLEISDRCVC